MGLSSALGRSHVPGDSRALGQPRNLRASSMEPVLCREKPRSTTREPSDGSKDPEPPKAEKYIMDTYS